MEKLFIIRRRSSTLVLHPEKQNKAGFAKLEKRLSVFEADARKRRWCVFKAMLYDVAPSGAPVLRLPAEVDDDLLKAAFPDHTITAGGGMWEARKVDVFFHTGKYPYKNGQQARIVDYLRRRNAFEKEPDTGRRMIQAGTAVGKSYCAIRAWVERGDVLLGSFAQATHLSNFHAELLKFTSLTEDQILVVDDGRDTIRKFLAKPELAQQYMAVLVLHRTIWNCMKECINDGMITKVNDFVKFVQIFGVGTHASDECHLEYVSLVTLGMLLNVAETYYLSATPRRTDSDEGKVLAYQLPHQRALVIKSQPRLDASQIHFNSRPDAGDLLASVNSRGYFDVPWYFSYLEREAKWDRWFELVTELIRTAFDSGQATSVGVVVAGRLEFLQRVVDKVKEEFPDRSVGNFSSLIKKYDQKMLELDKEIVITTEKSFGGSVNPEKMSHMVFGAPLSSPVAVEQIVGRLRGINGNPCVLYDLCDDGFEKLRDQAKRRRTTIKKLSVSFEEYEWESAGALL